MDDRKSDSSVVQPVDVTTPTTTSQKLTGVRPQSDIHRENLREREPRQTINDERLNHQTAPLDAADSRQVSNSLVLKQKLPDGSGNPRAAINFSYQGQRFRSYMPCPLLFGFTWNSGTNEDTFPCRIPSKSNQFSSYEQFHY